MNIKRLESFPAGSNPFKHDHFREGTTVGKNDTWTIMWGTSEDDIIVVDVKTGERMQIERGVDVRKKVLVIHEENLKCWCNHEDHSHKAQISLKSDVWVDEEGNINFFVTNVGSEFTVAEENIEEGVDVHLFRKGDKEVKIIEHWKMAENGLSFNVAMNTFGWLRGFLAKEGWKEVRVK